MNGPFQLVYLFWIKQCSALFKISTWLEGGVGHRQSFYIFILIPWSTLPLFVSRVSNFFNGLTVHSSDGSVHISQTILWKKCYRFHICISNEGTNCHQVVKKKSYLRVKPETMMGNQDTGRKEATHRFFRFLLGATATLVKASFVWCNITDVDCTSDDLILLWQVCTTFKGSTDGGLVYCLI